MNREQSKTAVYLRVVLATVGLVLFQTLYSRLCGALCRLTLETLDLGLSEYQNLMIHHAYMFLLVLIPTALLQARGQADFGFHVPKARAVAKCLPVITAVFLLLSLVDGLFQVRLDLQSVGLSYYLFQFFFSGTGEEILYRALPIVALDWALGAQSNAEPPRKLRADVPVIISAALFALAHLSGYAGQPLYAQAYGMLAIFAAGLVFGWTYRKTRSVWACMLGHGWANIMVSVFPTLNYFILG